MDSVMVFALCAIGGALPAVVRRRSSSAGPGRGGGTCVLFVYQRPGERTARCCVLGSWTGTERPRAAFLLCILAGMRALPR